MSKWVSCGFAPRNDPETVHARQVESRLFRENLPLVLANADRILGTPRYFFCRLDSAYMSSLWWFGGGGPIPLGVLLLLWRKGKVIFECPVCKGRLHATGVSGSMLSGCGCVWGPCLDCGREKKLVVSHLGPTMLAIGPLLSEYRNQPVIRKGKQPRFDWKDGLVGESTPDVVIVPAIEPSPLNVLIAELGGPPVESGSASSATSTPLEPPQRGIGPFNLTKRRPS